MAQTSANSQKETFGPAVRAYSFFGRSSLSFPAGKISMDRRLAAILVTDVVGQLSGFKGVIFATLGTRKRRSVN